MFVPSKHLLSAFYATLPSKRPSKNLAFTESPHRCLLRTLLRRTYFEQPSKNPFKTPLVCTLKHGLHSEKALEWALSGPLNRLNAILSLLHPLDRYRTASAIGSAIVRPYLALSRIHAQVGVLDRLFLNRLEGSTTR